MYLLAFNGPPQSGKDTLAEIVDRVLVTRGIKIPVYEKPLNYPLRQIAYAMVGDSYTADSANYEAFKLTLFQGFGYKSGRQLLIDVSERFLKPVYGEVTLAKILQASLGDAIQQPGLLITTDLGFQVEADYLSQVFGANNMHVVQVEREGASYQQDSRERVNHPQGHQSVCSNNGSLADLEQWAASLYDSLVNEQGWQL